MKKILTIVVLLLTGMMAWSQAPGTTPVKVSNEKQMMHGRKYYVHIVEKGQTVYSISRAYRVESYDAVTHVDIHALQPGDTVWLPFRGQFSESEEQSAQAPAPTPAPAKARVDTVHVHDTAYVHIHDTAFFNVPYAVHDTVIVTKTVTEYVPLHDTVIVTKTVTEYVPVHDTVIVTNMVTENVPVHDTVIVTKTVTESVPVHDTVIVTKTVTESVPVHDTAYITVHDTAYVNVPYAVHDTTVITDAVTRTEYVTVHDTAYITVHDTTFVVDTVKVAYSYDLALASDYAVPLTEYLSESQRAVPTTEQPSPVAADRKSGNVLKVALMMPLHLDQADRISTSKFDVEQRGKKSYKEFEFIEFYEGVLLALDRLAEQGVSVELNVVDVSENSVAKVEEAWNSHHVGQSDFVVALLLRDCFDRAAELAQQASVYIVNPMATRSDLCATNPYIVKVQPSLSGMINLMLNNMKHERPDAHLYVIHSNDKNEKAVMDELKRQLAERGDIKYTLFNWSQSARMASVLKATPNCNVISVYDQGKENNRVYTINLLNRLSSIKKDSPTLYTLTDWTREYGDIDFAQLQLLGYHTYSLAWDMSNEVHVQFLQAYRSRFGGEPTSQLAATGHDLMLYIAGGLSRRNSDFWQHPGNSLPTLIQPLHLGRNGAGLENDKAQLYRLDDLRFVKALFK